MNKSFHTYWRELASGKLDGFWDRFLLLLLTPLGWLYSLALSFRSQMYKYGLLKTVRLPRPVVSIGNITVGGTGKTPVTTRIARMLLAQGYRVAVLSRGYGGSLEGQNCIVSDGTTVMRNAVECGDEPYLMATTVPGLMVVIGTDRYAAGQLAMQQLSPDIFLLDDGFQHLRLHRDLNILLLDYARPFGNKLIIPAGILRESVSALSRADMILFTRAPDGATNPVNTHGTPHCMSSHTIVDLLPLESGAAMPFSNCKNSRILAFAGIAEPDLFFDELRRMGLNLVQCIHLPDHVVYDQNRSDEIMKVMGACKADLIVTTEKDGVKMKGLQKQITSRTLLARLDLTISDPDRLTRQLTGVVQGFKE